MTTEHSSSIARFRSMSQLSDYQLKADFYQLNQKDHRLDAELLLYLGELDQRRLYREEACSSAFGYCVTRLGYSEDVAYKRVGAARLMRQFPRIYDLLAEGKIHLTALMLLKSHLTMDNHEEWLLAACNKSKREVEMLVATRCPVPAAQTSVRRLPSPKQTSMPTTPTTTRATESADEGDLRLKVEAESTPPSAQAVAVSSASPSTASIAGTGAPAANPTAQNTAFGQKAAPLVATPREGSAGSTGSTGSPMAAGSTGSAAHIARASRVAPLSSSTYQVTFTASEQLKQKLDRARELLSHRIPPTDLPALIERALDQLLEREQTRRYGSPQKRKPAESPRRDCPKPVNAVAEYPQASSANASPTSLREDQKPLDPDPNLANNLATGHGVVPATSTLEGTSTSATAANHRRRPAAEVRRAVFERDSGQCTYVDQQGRRCDQRHFLEFDHIEAYAIGGTETESNLRLRCRGHNILEAEKLFGQTRVQDAITHARQSRAP